MTGKFRYVAQGRYSVVNNNEDLGMVTDQVDTCMVLIIRDTSKTILIHYDALRNFDSKRYFEDTVKRILKNENIEIENSNVTLGVNPLGRFRGAVMGIQMHSLKERFQVLNSMSKNTARIRIVDVSPLSLKNHIAVTSRGSILNKIPGVNVPSFLNRQRIFDHKNEFVQQDGCIICKRQVIEKGGNSDGLSLNLSGVVPEMGRTLNDFEIYRDSKWSVPLLKTTVGCALAYGAYKAYNYCSGPTTI